MTYPFHKLLFLVLLIGLFFVPSCSKDSAPLPTSTDKELISFSVKKADGSDFQVNDITVTIKPDSVLIVLPAGTAVDALTPIISIKGKTISPASGVSQDFRQPLRYTITAEDGSSISFVVVVRFTNGPFVFFGSTDNNFYALNALTGALIWKYSGTAPFAYSSPTYDSGIVYVGGIDNYVYSFDAANGNVKWKKNIASTGIESDAVFDKGTLYVGTNDDYLYALDAKSGATRWTFLTGGNISSSPVIADGRVYFGSSDGKIYAVNSQTGQLIWSYQTGGMINQSGAALVSGTLYVGSRDGYLYAINATDGTVRWRFYASGVSLEQSSPTVANGLVYIGGWYDIASFTQRGSLYALNANSGQLVWESIKNTGISSSPCVANGSLFITSDDSKLHAINAATGALLWDQTILANSASPAVWNNMVFVGGGGSRYFYAFDASNGNEKWRFPLPTGLMTSAPLIIYGNNQSSYSGDSGAQQ